MNSLSPTNRLTDSTSHLHAVYAKHRRQLVPTSARIGAVGCDSVQLKASLSLLALVEVRTSAGSLPSLPRLGPMLLSRKPPVDLFRASAGARRTDRDRDRSRVRNGCRRKEAAGRRLGARRRPLLLLRAGLQPRLPEGARGVPVGPQTPRPRVGRRPAQSQLTGAP